MIIIKMKNNSLLNTILQIVIVAKVMHLDAYVIELKRFIVKISINVVNKRKWLIYCSFLTSQ